jgi:hypothetical protein
MKDESKRMNEFHEELMKFGSKMLDEVLENLRENGGKSGYNSWRM